VKDPKTAELLCPKYSFAIKRPPVSNFYYESFNRENVSLVDVKNDPIVEITPKGIRTENNEYELDIIIFAIGFDGVTGGSSSTGSAPTTSGTPAARRMRTCSAASGAFAAAGSASSAFASASAGA